MMWKAKIGMLVLFVAFGMSNVACKSATSAANSAMTGATSQPTSAPASRPSMLQQGAAGAMALVKMLGGGDASAKASAKQKLLAMGASALPALISALKGGSNATKKGALDVIGSMGKKASTAAAPVKSLTTSKDPGVSKAAKDTLAKIH